MAEGPAGAPSAPPAENLPEFKAPTVTPPAPIQGADAAYNEQVGKIEFQLGNQLSGDRNTFEDTRKTYEYNKALLPAKEYEGVGRQRFAAAAGGFANSGFEARAQGRLQAKFLDTRTKMATAYERAQQKVNTRAQEEVGGRGIALKGAGTAAEGRFKAREVKNAPQEPQAQTGFAPQAGSTVPGGGYPNIPVGPRGFATAEYGVGQGTDKPMRGTRLAAANKAKRR